MYFPTNFVLPFIYLTTESDNAMLCSCTSHPATAAGDHCSGFVFVLCCFVLCNWWPMFWSENTSTEGTSSHRLIRCSGR